MSVNEKRRLKNLLIDPKFQIKYIFWLTSTGFTIVVANTTLFYWFVRENYKFLVEMSPMTDEAKAILFDELTQIVWTLIGISAGFLVLVALLGLIFSHRTAGPLYHFQRIFNLIREGKLSSRVNLRPNDDFQSVAASFNEMMDKLEAMNGSTPSRNDRSPQ